MTCLYFSKDERYDKGTAKCLRKSFIGAPPLMVTLKDCATCELCFYELPGWVAFQAAFIAERAEENRKRQD